MEFEVVGNRSWRIACRGFVTLLTSASILAIAKSDLARRHIRPEDRMFSHPL